MKLSKLVDWLIGCIKIFLYAVFAFFLVVVSCIIVFGEMTAIAEVSFNLPDAISLPLHILLILFCWALSFVVLLLLCWPLSPVLNWITPDWMMPRKWRDEQSKSKNATEKEPDIELRTLTECESPPLQRVSDSRMMRMLAAFERIGGSWPVTMLGASWDLGMAAFGYAMFFSIAWAIALEVWPPYTLLVDLAGVTIVFRTFSKKYARFINRLEAFFWGPTISFRRLVQYELIPTFIALVIGLACVLATRGWLSRISQNGYPDERAFDHLPIELCSSILIGFAALELRRHAQLLRDVWRDYSEQKELRRSFKWSTTLPDLECKEKPFVLCHLTDLHLTKSPDTRTVSGEGPGLWKHFRELLSCHAVPLDESDAILITGDLTDTASPDEWNGFFNAFCGFERWFKKMVIVPGNHDVNLCDLDLLRRDNRDRMQRKSNLIRFMAAVDRIQGERTSIVWKDKLISFRKWGLLHGRDFKTFLTTPPARTTRTVTTFYSGADGMVLPMMVEEDETPPETLRAIAEPEDAWSDSFPMVVKIPNHKVIFLVLDTNMPGSNVVTNAFGWISPDQVAKARRILEHYQDRPIIVALHHHLGNPFSSKTGLQGKAGILDRGLTLCNAGDLLGIFPESRSYIAFNGHRHLHYTGVVNERISIVSGASTTLGNCFTTSEEREDVRPRVSRYHLFWDDFGLFKGLKRLPTLW